MFKTNVIKYMFLPHTLNERNCHTCLNVDVTVCSQHATEFSGFIIQRWFTLCMNHSENIAIQQRQYSELKINKQ